MCLVSCIAMQYRAVQYRVVPCSAVQCSDMPSVLYLVLLCSTVLRCAIVPLSLHSSSLFSSLLSSFHFLCSPPSSFVLLFSPTLYYSALFYTARPHLNYISISLPLPLLSTSGFNNMKRILNKDLSFFLPSILPLSFFRSFFLSFLLLSFLQMQMAQ